VNWIENFGCFFTKNGIFTSHWFSIAIAHHCIRKKKKNTLTGTQKLTEKHFGIGYDERPKTEWWILIERALVYRLVPEILLSKVCRVDIDVQQLTWTHYGIEDERESTLFFFSFFPHFRHIESKIEREQYTVWYGIYTFGTSAGVVSRSTGQK
jgi:hypothetical protein